MRKRKTFDSWLSVRVSSKDLEVLREAARALDLSVSALVRYFARLILQPELLESAIAEVRQYLAKKQHGEKDEDGVSQGSESGISAQEET